MRFWTGFLVLGVILSVASAEAFSVSCPSLSEGGWVPMTHVYKGGGFNGANRSPALHWFHIPAGTKSFAVTVYDPDAPHPGGWWHWLVVDIPASASGLSEGARPGAGLPAGARQTRNDFNTGDYGGPAPPPGKPHRYIYTVYALKAAHLNVSGGDAPSKVATAIDADALAKVSITAWFGHP